MTQPTIGQQSTIDTDMMAAITPSTPLSSAPALSASSSHTAASSLTATQNTIGAEVAPESTRTIVEAPVAPQTSNHAPSIPAPSPAVAHERDVVAKSAPAVSPMGTPEPAQIAAPAAARQETPVFGGAPAPFGAGQPFATTAQEAPQNSASASAPTGQVSLGSPSLTNQVGVGNVPPGMPTLS